MGYRYQNKLDGEANRPYRQHSGLLRLWLHRIICCLLVLLALAGSVSGFVFIPWQG